MKAVGLITEYNPFHNGHRYHIEKSKELTGADTAVVIMSGNYVQRGTPAIIDKYTRTAIALDHGADLVFELPVSYSTSSAEFFARGAVESLHALGFVDCLCFGSELSSLEEMKELAQLLFEEPPQVSALIKEKVKEGMSYPKARMSALLEYSNGPSEKTQLLLSSPNTLLGLEYLKALYQLNSPIEPFLLLREGMSYHDSFHEESTLNSATALRGFLTAEKRGRQTEPSPEQSEALFSLLGKNMPENALHLLERKYQVSFPVTENDYSSILYYKLLYQPVKELSSYADMNEELAFRMKNHLEEFQSFTSFGEKIKSRQYTMTRIHRCFLHIILNIRQMPDTLPYLRLLGLKREASMLLNKKSLHTAVPIITKPADAPAQLPPSALPYWELSINASLLYNRIIFEKFGTRLKDDYRAPVIVR